MPVSSPERMLLESVSANFVFSIPEFNSHCGRGRLPVQLASSILSIGLDVQALSFSLASAAAHLALGFLPPAFLPRPCYTAGMDCLKSRGCRHWSIKNIRFKCCLSESLSFVANPSNKRKFCLARRRLKLSSDCEGVCKWDARICWRALHQYWGRVINLKGALLSARLSGFSYLQRPKLCLKKTWNACHGTGSLGLNWNLQLDYSHGQS